MIFSRALFVAAMATAGFTAGYLATEKTPFSQVISIGTFGCGKLAPDNMTGLLSRVQKQMQSASPNAEVSADKKAMVVLIERVLLAQVQAERGIQARVLTDAAMGAQGSANLAPCIVPLVVDVQTWTFVADSPLRIGGTIALLAGGLSVIALVWKSNNDDRVAAERA